MYHIPECICKLCHAIGKLRYLNRLFIPPLLTAFPALLLSGMKLSASLSIITLALANSAFAAYKLTWYTNYGCQNNPVSYCAGLSGCCSAPAGINSVYIEWDDPSYVAAR
ncbi:hypothetical protein BDZ94DRAFT_82435 [Collybia nuda]|uniref:Uncharacterized protein n=1 Tax=Collybia nuda TaxID=64659 RepID=A0A9P5XX05_9AGAR|nr:hypothetical protein BDZ94DRAFT_82435 [Collybia nuda]